MGNKNANFVSHKKSKQKVDGKPQLPLASALVEGEIAINFAKDVETLSIKNESGDVVTFSSDNYYTEQKLGSGFTGENSAVTVTQVIDEIDLVTSSALNDLENRKLDASAYTPTVELWVSGTGENAIVQKGGNNTASGKLSVAMGSGTTASGDYSVAEGKNTTASGVNSHAEGSGTIASGNYSHAEGWSTTASGVYSHAEGYNTKASGDTSHAEGRYTIASGGYSHAEGQSTKASAHNSHAEGDNTKANGYASHAEGYYTSATSYVSHAEGYYTITLNDSEHASGQYNDSVSASTTFGDSGNTLFSVGNGTASDARHNAFEIRQNGDIYIVSGGTNIKLQDNIGGSIEIDQVIDSGTSASTDAVSTSAVYGFVTSYTPSITVDQDFSNTASTNPISTKAVYSAVTDNELVWTNAYVAMSGTVSAHTADTNIHITSADRTKLDSITSAFGTMAYENTSSYSSATEVNTALGGKANTATTLDGYGITNAYTKTEVDARDLWVSGTGTNAVAQKGGNNTASGTSSHAEGQGTKAGGESSHSEGQDTVANGNRSHAEGYNTSATTNASHAEGVGTLASGPISHAEGQATVADGSNSHSEGLLTAASGYASHAEGFYTRAFGQYSHAEGDSAKASGYSSHAEGANTIANNTAEHASGQYNVSSSSSETFGHSGNTLFSVGNGTSSDARHNAFEIKQNGDIYITSGNSDIKLQDYIGSVETVTAITPSNSGSTEPIATKVVAENELTVSNALNDLNTNKADKTEDLDGIKLKKITQSAYDQLQTKDPNTLYIISD